MLRTYIETSVWGMVHPDQGTALREATLEFFSECKAGAFLPHISDVVVNEVRNARQDIQDRILAQISDIDPVLLEIPLEGDELAQRFIEAGVLSVGRLDDARHVACAIVNDLDLLVSWNYRHIANVHKAERFLAVAVLSGRPSALSIHTPLEVLEWR